MKKRGEDKIIKRGREMKKKNEEILENIEKSYGVKEGKMIEIWGMEKGFG